MLRFRLGTADRTALLTLLGLCLLLKGIVLARQPILARDGVYYIKFAHALTDQTILMTGPGPSWQQVLRDQPYHPAYPVLIAGFAKAYQYFHPGDLSPLEWQACAHLASSLAGVLLVIPLFGLARCFVSTGIAWLGTALFLVLPATVQITTDTLADSWLLFFLLSALWCLVRGVREPRIICFALAGALAGSGYLVRVEALLIPAGTLLALVTQRWWTGTTMSLQHSLRSGLVVAATFLCVTLPYMVVIGKVSSRPSVNQVVQAAQDSLKADTGSDSVLFASRRQDGVNGERIDAVKLGEAVVLVVTAHGKAGHYFIWPLAAIGVVVFWRSHRRDPASALLACVALVHLAMLLRLAYSAGYTSERHTLLFVSVACLAAALGLATFYDQVRRRLTLSLFCRSVLCAGICVAVVALCIPKAIQPLHAGQEGHRQAGFWIAEQGYDRATLIDPYLWASFYAGKLTPPAFPMMWRKSDPAFNLTDEEVRKRLENPIRPHYATHFRTFGIVDPQDADLNRKREWEKAGVVGSGSYTHWTWPSSTSPRLLVNEVIRPPAATASR